MFDMEKTDANDGNHGLSMASTIIQGGWASPQNLYMGAFECAASGFFGQGLVNLDADGGLDLNCLSQLTECYIGSETCAVALVNGGCPVQTC